QLASARTGAPVDALRLVVADVLAQRFELRAATRRATRAQAQLVPQRTAAEPAALRRDLGRIDAERIVRIEAKAALKEAQRRAREQETRSEAMTAALLRDEPMFECASARVRRVERPKALIAPQHIRQLVQQLPAAGTDDVVLKRARLTDA